MFLNQLGAKPLVLGSMVTLFLALQETINLPFEVAVQFCIPTSK